MGFVTCVDCWLLVNMLLGFPCSCRLMAMNYLDYWWCVVHPAAPAQPFRVLSWPQGRPLCLGVGLRYKLQIFVFYKFAVL